MPNRTTERFVSEIVLITRVSAPCRRYFVGYVGEQLGIPVHEICLGAAYTKPQGPALSAGPGATAKPTRFEVLRHHWRVPTTAIEHIARTGNPGVIVHGCHDPAFLRVMATCKRRDVPGLLRDDPNTRDDHGRPRNRVPIQLLPHEIDNTASRTS